MRMYACEYRQLLSCELRIMFIFRYGSALLSAYITKCKSATNIRNMDDNEDCRSRTVSKNPLHRRLLAADTTPLTVLELGSGAVGISGLCMAWYLAQTTRKTQRHVVILSDNETECLRQLQRNVQNNSHIYQYQEGEAIVDCRVQQIYWGQTATTMQSTWNAFLNVDCVDIILGSELVYTPETAAACRDCLVSLTRQYPRALVCIVQIVDREGWQNIFLPGLRDAGLYIREEAVDVECDAAAHAMMKRGGSLDRFDFGICYMSRSPL